MPVEFVPSPNIVQLRPSATIAVSTRAKALKAQGREIIDLGVGEPDFDTPEFVKIAAAKAVAAGHTKYTATEGILPLREAIAKNAGTLWAGDAAQTPVAADVVVSNGSKQTLFNACFCLFGAGDEVLIPTPAWTSYVEIVALSARGEALGGYLLRSHKTDDAWLGFALSNMWPRTFRDSSHTRSGKSFSGRTLTVLTARPSEARAYLNGIPLPRRIAGGKATFELSAHPASRARKAILTLTSDDGPLIRSALSVAALNRDIRWSLPETALSKR